MEKRKSVLIAVSDTMACDQLRVLLLREALDVEVCHDADAAAALCQQGVPDLLIADDRVILAPRKILESLRQRNPQMLALVWTPDQADSALDAMGISVRMVGPIVAKRLRRILVHLGVIDAGPGGVAVAFKNFAVPVSAPRDAQQPPRPGDGQLPSAGDLTAVAPLRLCCELAHTRFTGTLRLDGWGERCELVFSLGQVCALGASPDASCGLIDALFERTMVSAEIKEQCRRAVTSTGCSELDAVVYAGVVTQEQALEVLRQCLSETLQKVAMWTQGTYTLSADFPTTLPLALQVNALEVMAHAIKRELKLGELLARFDRVKERFLAAAPGCKERLTLTGNVFSNFDFNVLDGKTTLKEALQLDGSQAFEMGCALHLLKLAGLITFANETSAPLDINAAAPRMGLGLADYAAVAAASAALESDAARLQNLDARARLGLQASASRQAVAAAYQRCIADLDSKRALAGLPPESQKLALRIEAILTEAYQSLLAGAAPEADVADLELSLPT